MAIKLPESADLNDPSVRSGAINSITAITDEDERNDLLLQLSELCAKEWLLKEAESVIDLAKHYPKDCSDAYVRIAEQFVNLGQYGRTLPLLIKARALVGSIVVPWQAAESLCRIARTIWKCGKHDEARADWTAAAELAKQGEASTFSQERVDSSSVLSEIAVDVARAGDVEAAVELAQSIQDSGKRARACEQVQNIAVLNH